MVFIKISLGRASSGRFSVSRLRNSKSWCRRCRLSFSNFRGLNYNHLVSFSNYLDLLSYFRLHSGEQCSKSCNWFQNSRMAFPITLLTRLCFNNPRWILMEFLWAYSVFCSFLFIINFKLGYLSCFSRISHFQCPSSFENIYSQAIFHCITAW